MASMTQTRRARAVTQDSPPASVEAPDLRVFVFALFFIFGGITSLNDVLIPKLKDLFSLTYAQVMLVQSAFFAAYLTISIPASMLVKRIGYMRSAVAGLLMMLFGCLLFIPASASARFGVFLLALFVLASGITVVQVVANPLISMLGPPQTAHSRLTFAQAFNSLGTTVFPYVGALLILGSLAHVEPHGLSGAALEAYRVQESHAVVQAYLGLAVVLGLVAAVVWTRRHRLVETPGEAALHPLQAFGLLRRPRFAMGALCIFLYVGAEVAIGSLIISFLAQPQVMGLAPKAAGQLAPLYWGGAMAGRFIGAWFLRLFPPGNVLAGVATSAILLLGVSANSSGVLAGYTLLAIGLCNAIMFPTIFSLGCEGLGERAADGSGLICVAIVGGAVVPLLTGCVADVGGLQLALGLPAVCYAVIVTFGVVFRRPALAPVVATNIAPLPARQSRG